MRQSAGKIWRGFTAIARAEGVCESVIRNRMKLILTKLKNCGIVRCGAVAFARVSTPASAPVRCAGL